MFGFRFVKVQPTTHLMAFRRGKVTRQGAGFSMFYYSPTTTLVAVPLASHEEPFIFEKVTADFQTVTVQGLVAAVDGGQLVLNVGAKAGVKVGDQLNVERVTKEIKDPATGQVLRRLSQPVGVVKVTDVDDVSSIATPVSGSGFQTGDAVKTVTQ